MRVGSPAGLENLIVFQHQEDGQTVLEKLKARQEREMAASQTKFMRQIIKQREAEEEVERKRKE